MAGAEAERGAARVEVGEVVGGVGDGQVALVFGAVGVGVPDERRFPVVVQVGVGDGDEVSGVGDVEKAVVVVLVMVAVGGEVEVVDPDVLRLVGCQCMFTGSNVRSYLLDGDSITTDDLLDGEVAENHVLRILDGDGEVLEDGVAVLSDDGLVAANLDVVTGALDGSCDEDNGSVVALDSGSELTEGRDLDRLAALTTSGSAVRGSVTNGGNVLKRSSTLGDGALDIDHARVGAARAVMAVRPRETMVLNFIVSK